MYCRLIIEDKYKPIIQTYVKQRLLMHIKYFNQNMVSFNKIRKSKL